MRYFRHNDHIYVCRVTKYSYMKNDDNILLLLLDNVITLETPMETNIIVSFILNRSCCKYTLHDFRH